MLRLFCVLGLLLPAASARAQQEGACPPPPPSQESLRPDDLHRDVRDRGLLWRVEKGGRTSWLYGTVHVNRVEWVVPGPGVQEALSRSDVLALELDPGDPDLARLLEQPGDAAREARVVEGLQPRIAQLARRACLPPERLATMRPLFQLMMLGFVEGRRGGFHPEFSVDLVLHGLAKRTGKAIAPLETAAGQMAALVPQTEADERVLMQRGLEDLESGESRATLDRMLQAWARGDAAALASYPQWCGCLDTEAEQRFFRRVNDERNAGLAERIDKLHAKGQRVFAAVGALHMTGPQSLPVLLRARGYQVQAVPLLTR
ncbi:MAG TPA: TraB/GumN family protein [Ramlibacter sp.]|uniref:TraB/GumN family protein n=1 Tax=Ramlibacter sp. TaxID=1917967 RepID=UPI002ED2CE8F